jgi:uncharacterized protein
MPPISVLIKPASGKCNLSCRYCFYHDVASNRAVADFGFMDQPTLEVIIRKVLQFASGQATFSFQGGEPTLCGVGFFESVVKLQKRYNVNGVKIDNCLQTNGILIDENWAEFLHSHNFLVGLSLDGPADLHDRYRVDSRGNGTSGKVISAAALFDKYKVEYNILLTVTGASAADPDVLYDFFKQHNFNFLQFMPCLDPGSGPRGLYDYSLKPEQYHRFLKGFFDKWSADFLGGREVSVRYFDNLVRMVMGQAPEMCSLFGGCQCQFVFEADGGVYPCDFYVTDTWKLGNIKDHELLELYESVNSRRFRESSQSASAVCRECKWRYLCRGGCRRDREDTLTGILERNYYCQAFQDFLEYASPRLVKLAEYVKTMQSRPRSAAGDNTNTKG